MAQKGRLVGVVVLLSAAGVGAACISSSNNPPPGGTDGGFGSSSGGFAGSSSGGSSGGGSSGGSSGAGGSSGGASSGSSSGAASSDGGVPIAATLALPGYPSGMAYNETTNELWVTSQGPNDAGSNVSAITIVDPTTFTAKDTVSFTGSFAGLTGIVAAPDLGKYYIANTTAIDGGGPRGEIDVVDGTTHAVKFVASFQGDLDSAQSLAYDPVQHRVYATVTSKSYMYVIDATSDSLLTTFPSALIADAGLGAYGNVAVDPSGNLLYLLTGDQNFYPMVATLPVDGGPPFDVLGGQAAGWRTSIGPVVVTTDAGTSGAAAIGLSDGGHLLQIIDPATIQLFAGDVPLGIAVISKPPENRGDVAISVIDACGKRKVRFFDPKTGLEYANWDILVASMADAVFDEVQIDPATATGTKVHVAVIIEPQPGDSTSARHREIDEIILDTSAPVTLPCP